MKFFTIYFLAAVTLALTLPLEQNAAGKDYWVFLEDTPEQMTSQAFAQSLNLQVITSTTFDGMNVFRVNLDDKMFQQF
jgi:hypothetical protein